jgi:hypothetical protein
MSNPTTSVLGNMSMVKAGAAAGTTTTLTTGALSIVIQGKYYTVAAATNGAATTTDGITGAAFAPVPVGGAQLYVVAYTAAGARKICQGPVLNSYPVLGGSGALDFPNLPDELCAVAYVIVAVGSTGAAWTWGTSNLSAATGVTYTFQDVAWLPPKPQAV